MRALDRDEPPEQVTELALHEELPDLRRAPAGKEHRRARRPGGDPLAKHLDRAREARVHREPVAKLDRRGEHVSEREPPVVSEGREPRVGRSRRHGPRDADGHVVPMARAVRREVEARRPMPKAIDRLGLAHAGLEHHDRRDAAEVGEVTLDDVQRDAGGDPRIDRAPAAREHAQAGDGREVVARAHHVPAAEKCRAALLYPDRRDRGLDADLAHARTIPSTQDAHPRVARATVRQRDLPHRR